MWHLQLLTKKPGTVAPLLVNSQTKVATLKVHYCTKYVILWILQKHVPRATILSVTDKQSVQTGLFRLCFQLLHQIEDDWDLWLDSVTFAYNTSKHDTLGNSPYKVVFGQLPRLPVELELGMPLKNPSIQSKYLASARSVFHDVRCITEEHLSKASEKQARLNQPTNTWRPFESGKTVMLKRPKGWKLGNKWVELFRIVKLFGVNYRIVSKGGKVMVVHHDQLKHSHIPFQAGEPVCPSRRVPGG